MIGRRDDAQEAAVRDYGLWEMQLREEAKALDGQMPLSYRVLMNYANIVHRARRAERMRLVPGEIAIKGD